MSPTNTDNLKDQLNEAGSHLKAAANAAGSAVKGVASSVSDEAVQAKAKIKAELSESAQYGKSAASAGGAVAKEQVDALLDKSKDLIDSAAELIREKPLASFGVAFAAGFLIAKLTRGSND